MITGYVIVRKPAHIFDDVVGKSLSPSIEGIYYHGIDRSNWRDVESRFYQSKIPESLLKTYADLDVSELDFTGIKVVKAYHDAVAFLSIDKEMALTNELVVVASDRLNQIKGPGIATPQHITWLGYDIVLLRGWSLIRHAIFENREMSLLETIKLNSFGLLDHVENVDDFLETYDKLGDLDRVDPLPENGVYGIDYLRVGRIMDVL
ncbi:hypothetical protein [Chitinophaga qingshengii]|nr:hypothetical protein [Chitinophaga qingshengii]